MNHQHSSYYPSVQIGDIPRHQLQHSGPPPPVPLVMTQPHNLVPYGIAVQRHPRPLYHTAQQPSPHMMRPQHPVVAPLPVPVAQNHPSVMDPVRVRYPIAQPVVMPYQNQIPEIPVVKPTPPAATTVAPVAPASEQTPLDLSAKPWTVKTSAKQQTDSKPMAQAAIVQFTDQPLDLTKTAKTKPFSQTSDSAIGDKRSSVNLKSPIIRAGQEQSCSSAANNDMDQDLSGSQGGLNSVRSLIGNHPTNDILYMHCARCPAHYGNIHAFKKHFHNSHGYMPRAEDVLIQSIKSTKEYVTNKNEARRHCIFCGWQCEQTNPSVFFKHIQEHLDNKGCYFKCIYCQQEFAEPNALKLHVVQHVVPYTHICVPCSLAFSSEDQLTAHMLSQHEPCYANRKVNLPVSVVLPSPSIMASAKHETSPKLFNPYQLGKMRPSYPQSYADHMQPKLTPVRASGSPRPPNLNTPIFAHSLPHKHVSLSSPKYMESGKANSPSSTTYKKPHLSSPGISSSPGMHSLQAAAETSKETTHQGAAPFNLMSLLDKVVEQGLKNNDGRMSGPTSTSMSARRALPPASTTSHENGNRLAGYSHSTQSVTSSQTPSLIDLSRHMHSNFSPVSTAPFFFETSNTRQHVRTLEAIDIPKHHSSFSQYSSSTASPTLIDFSQKQAQIPGYAITTSSVVTTHNVYLPGPSPRRNVCSTASDQQKTLCRQSSVKTPLVDITGGESSADASSQDQQKATQSIGASENLSAVNQTVSHNFKREMSEVSESECSHTENNSTVSVHADKNAPQLDLLAADSSDKEVSKPESKFKTVVNCKSESKPECVMSRQSSGERTEPSMVDAAKSKACHDKNIAEMKVERDLGEQCMKIEDKTNNLSNGIVTTAMTENEMISNIIDKAVKETERLDRSHPSIPKSPVSSKVKLEQRDCKSAVSGKSSSSATLPKSPRNKSEPSSDADAITVSWTEAKDSQQSLEVDRIQAMSACRVLLSPHNFPVQTSKPFDSSLDKDDQTNGDAVHSIPILSPQPLSALKKRSSDSGYSVAKSGALDMSKKCVSTSTCHDQSDSSACSSPKRLRIVEHE
ncbi:serine-rich adhesin for platelets-like isoform X2 [Watersipora subatra]